MTIHAAKTAAIEYKQRKNKIAVARFKPALTNYPSAALPIELHCSCLTLFAFELVSFRSSLIKQQLLRIAYVRMSLVVASLCTQLIQWNSVNKSTSGQPVLDLIRGGFNKRRFLKCTKCSIFSVFIRHRKICAMKFALVEMFSSDGHPLLLSYHKACPSSEIFSLS